MATKNTEKERKRVEVLKRKFQLEQERITKPGECNKYITVVVSNEIVTGLSGSKIVGKLVEMEMKSKISHSATPYTITWQRTVTNKLITDSGEIIEFESVQKDEPHLLMVLEAEKFVKGAKDNELLSIVQGAQEVLPFYPVSTTLVIYGLKEFCRKRRNVIGIKETEIKLTQLQILANCSHRLHETPDDIALTVSQMSRAIAEEPFKAKKNQKLDQEQLYLTSDVKVSVNDDDASSFARLWQTQLTCLPKVTYEVAQSIAKEYPLPRLLIKAYSKSENPVKMLADIPIIRTGPLAKTRRIGPELSRKIYTLMMSKNSEDIL